MTIFLTILQVVTAVVFVILMAVQTDKNQQGGVMGLGAQGGRMSGQVDMPVGAERILKPLSKWMAIGFLFASALAAMNGEAVEASNGSSTLSPFIVLGAIAFYAAIMVVGDKFWQSFMRLFGAQS